MKIKPINDRVVIKRLDTETETESGIIIPELAQEKPQRGEVLAVPTDFETDVQVGDVVLFAKYAGSDIELDGHKVVIMAEDEIFGVLE